MATESKSQGDYVSLGALFRLVQAGQRELGLPEYRGRSSLAFALVANRIPTKKITPRRKLYHAPTALRVLCPGTSVAKAEPESTQQGEQWLPFSEVCRQANILRRSLHMPPFNGPPSIYATLRRKKVSRRRYGRRSYYWQLGPADPILDTCVERRLSALRRIRWDIVKKEGLSDAEDLLAEAQLRTVQDFANALENLDEGIAALAQASFRHYRHIQLYETEHEPNPRVIPTVEGLTDVAGEAVRRTLPLLLRKKN